MIARGMHLMRVVVLVAFMAIWPATCHQCVNAPGTTECGRQVQKAMLEGFAMHPDNYVGLTIHSTYSEFQAYFHNAGMHNCPRPCFPREEECVKFGPSYPGMGKVNWARNVGMAAHPEWYPELSSQSSTRQIAQALYMHGIEGCPRVCEDDEMEGHFEPFYEGVQMAKSEGWMKVAPKPTPAPTPEPTEAPATKAPTRAPTTEPPLTQPPTPAPTQPPTPAPTQPPTPAPTQPPTPAPTQPPTPAPTQPRTPAPTQPPTPAPTTAAPATTTKAKTTSKAPFVAEPPLPSLPSMPHAAQSAQDQSVHRSPEECFHVGLSFSLLDCLNHAPTLATSSARCKEQCAELKYASYFLYHVPLSLCHCPPAAATRVEDMGPDYIGGSVQCSADPADYMKRNDADMPALGTAPKIAIAISSKTVVVAAAASLAAVAAVGFRLGTSISQTSSAESARLIHFTDDADA